MAIAAAIMLGILALLHVYFLVLEMFLWTTPRVGRVFGLTPQFAAESKTLAANQGLYNGFLAAGMAWGLWLGESGAAIRVFFIVCALIAGLYGGATASRKIVFVQAIPAAIALALELLSRASH